MLWSIAGVSTVVVIVVMVFALRNGTMTGYSWLLMKTRPRNADNEAVRQILGVDRAGGRRSDPDEPAA